MSDLPSIDPNGKKPIVQSAKDFFGGALGALKGKDTAQLIEDFTAEMTLVAEGLSEDQTRIAREIDNLSAQQTMLEQSMIDQLHDVSVTLREVQDGQQKLSARLDKLEKQTADKKVKKVEGLTGLIRQATWLVAILSGAWVVTTIINYFR